ncbi:hypothetical protein PCASD_18708 [Puccinia coronata f. sp. avenae]|uniref:CxC1-like cysteine cluster associated with KDZ transposases domain-containing protein n=1 Tax=Puccinia coronata f. sp. avenae TaxID=200324 RepID=A0A2N5SSV0_9BASI|nr:hypothetical protein PCASD_18708 [Puccinia coronata f. sp. avenae]
MRSLQRLEALHRGELPLPSSSRALQEHLDSLQETNHGLQETNHNDIATNENWDTFDSGEWETFEETPAQPVTSLSQRIYDFNSRCQRERLVKNWNNIISQLHGVYMLLKIKTGNWTSNNAFDSMEDKFCKCTHFTFRTIDVFDLMWQKRIRQRFCKCTPDIVRLLALGYVASSPVRPKTAFSVRLLKFHNLAWQWCNVATLPFTELLSRWVEEHSGKLHFTDKRRDLRKNLSASVDIFRTLLLMTSEVVNRSLCLTKTETLARTNCAGCFGPTSPEDTHTPRSSVKDSLVVCLDGNFQHRHNAKAGASAPLSIPPVFLEPERVDSMRDDIANLATLDEPVDPCVESHKAANDKRCETTWKGCDDTGIMGCCCRHDQVLYLANIHRSGEQRCLPLAILKKLLEDLDNSRPVGVLYDIGCSLKKFLDLRSYFAFPEKKDSLRFGTSVFHAYAHEWKCQIKFNPRYNVGWGLSDALSHRCLFHNSEGQASLILWLRKKYSAAKWRRRQAKETLMELLQQGNPFASDGSNYTRQFFRDQWEQEVHYLDHITDEENDRREKLTKLLEKEEALKKLRQVLETREWSVKARLIERITDEINKTEVCQRELAEQLDFLYSSDTTDVAKEKSNLLIWGAKRQLYAKAVDIKGVRQPISESQTRGRRVGTKLKEKIYESIKKRKAAVLRIITKYNDRYEAHLRKYNPGASFVPLTWDLFVSFQLDDSFWDDIAFCGSQAPWAVSLPVREGIRTVHIIDRAEEELDMLAQELDRAMTWAVDLSLKLGNLATHIDNLPPGSGVEVTTTRVGTLDLKESQHALKFELVMQLASHHEMMRSWASDVEWLWSQTRAEGSSHPWFQRIWNLNVFPEPMREAPEDVDPELNPVEMDETLQEQAFLEEAEDGELAEDRNVDEMVSDGGWETDPD